VRYTQLIADINQKLSQFEQPEPEPAPTVKVSNKNQLKREQKLLQKAEEDRLYREQCMLESDTRLKALEKSALSELISKDGLQVVEIPSDGNCLFRAISKHTDYSWQELKDITVKAIRTTQSEEIRPFLPERFNSDVEKYADWLVSGWGGQIEMAVLSRELGRDIVVYLANDGIASKSRVESSGTGEDILIVFHKFKYGSPHYDSLIRH
jgi:hypothetical protein